MTLALAPYEPGQKRRRFGASMLERFPLTQPEWRCQRCGATTDGSLELDHMVELALGGYDHPYNLIRLCSRCHRAKPYMGYKFFEAGGTPMLYRLAILAWASDRRLVQWEDAEERAGRKELGAALRRSWRR